MPGLLGIFTRNHLRFLFGEILIHGQTLRAYIAGDATPFKAAGEGTPALFMGVVHETFAEGGGSEGLLDEAG